MELPSSICPQMGKLQHQFRDLPLAWAIVAVLVLAACGEEYTPPATLAHTFTPAPPAPTQAPTSAPTLNAVERSSQADDIREAVFRYQFVSNACGCEKEVYFLSLGRSKFTDKDPGDEFLERFQGHKPAVKKVSKSTTHVTEGVRDKETGESGLIFRVIEITWISDLEAEVEGGYYLNGLNSSGNWYRIALEGGEWVIKEETLRSVS